MFITNGNTSISLCSLPTAIHLYRYVHYQRQYIYVVMFITNGNTSMSLCSLPTAIHLCRYVHYQRQYIYIVMFITNGNTSISLCSLPTAIRLYRYVHYQRQYIYIVMFITNAKIMSIYVHRFEKLFCGHYIGDLLRLVLVHLTEKGLMFQGKGLEKLRVWGCFKAVYISDIEKWVT